MVSRLLKWAAATAALGLVVPAGSGAPPSPDVDRRIAALLRRAPLIDGHNDLPWALTATLGEEAGAADLVADARRLEPPRHTDLPRLKAGGVGGQFWSVWVPATLPEAEAVKATVRQIDVVRSFCQRYSDLLGMAYAAEDVRRLHRSGRIACLIGVEGGHQIGGSLAVLRQYYNLGARYLTLTHSFTTDWADSATDKPRHNGVTEFGRKVIAEMNRLGMLVDLSHVSPEVMKQSLEVARAPVIFSHSSARGLVDHPRNVPDDVLLLVAKNGGVVMVTFVPEFVSAARARWAADRSAEHARYSSQGAGLYVGQPQRAAAAMAEWDRLHPPPQVTIAEVADHIDYVRKVAGVDHVGIGADYDGVGELPIGLEGVEGYPSLLKELARRGWSDADLVKLAGGNILRAMQQAECVAQTLSRSRSEGGSICAASRRQRR